MHTQLSFLRIRTKSEKRSKVTWMAGPIRYALENSWDQISSSQVPSTSQVNFKKDQEWADFWGEDEHFVIGMFSFYTAVEFNILRFLKYMYIFKKNKNIILLLPKLDLNSFYSNNTLIGTNIISNSYTFISTITIKFYSHGLSK